MTNKFNMITVDEYLRVLDGTSELKLKDVDTMFSIERYLAEVAADRRNENIVDELLAEG